jgi:hypothetical protein
MDRVVLSGLLSAAQCLSTKLYILFFVCRRIFLSLSQFVTLRALVIHAVAGSCWKGKTDSQTLEG